MKQLLNTEMLGGKKFFWNCAIEKLFEILTSIKLNTTFSSNMIYNVIVTKEYIIIKNELS